MKKFMWIAVAVPVLAAIGVTFLTFASKAAEGPRKIEAGSFQSLPSGLKYAVIKPGTGKVAESGMVEVHYTGWLQSDGSKFDSSRDQRHPFQFTLGRGEVIPGWDQGVKGMKEGEERQLIVPPALGYGPQGSGPIPPNATLIFEVELLKAGTEPNHQPGDGHNH